MHVSFTSTIINRQATIACRLPLMALLLNQAPTNALSTRQLTQWLLSCCLECNCSIRASSVIPAKHIGHH